MTRTVLSITHARSLTFVSLPNPSQSSNTAGQNTPKLSFSDAKKTPGLISMAGRKLVVDRGSAADGYLQHNVRRKF